MLEFFKTYTKAYATTFILIYLSGSASATFITLENNFNILEWQDSNRGGLLFTSMLIAIIFTVFKSLKDQIL